MPLQDELDELALLDAARYRQPELARVLRRTGLRAAPCSSLSAYEERVRASMGPALKNSLRSKNMGYAMMRGDLMPEVILRILGPIGGIKRAMECERPLWLV